LCVAPPSPLCSEREAAAFAVKGLPVDPATGKPLPRGPTVPVPFKLATEALHREGQHHHEGGADEGGVGLGGGHAAHHSHHRDGRRGSSVSAAFAGRGGGGAPAAAQGLQLDGGMDVTAAGLVSAY
jgi:hypothetical protein